MNQNSTCSEKVVSSFIVPTVEAYSRSTKQTQLTSSQRSGILQFLLKGCKDEVLQRGVIKEASEQFKVTRKTIYRIWKRAKEQYDAGKAFADVSSRKHNCGRNKQDYSENLSRMIDIP